MSQRWQCKSGFVPMWQRISSSAEIFCRNKFARVYLFPGNKFACVIVQPGANTHALECSYPRECSCRFFTRLSLLYKTETFLQKGWHCCLLELPHARVEGCGYNVWLSSSIIHCTSCTQWYMYHVACERVWTEILSTSLNPFTNGFRLHSFFPTSGGYMAASTRRTLEWCL